MKLILMLMVLLGVSCAQSQKTCSKRFTKKDKLFIRAVLRHEKETMISAVKRKDSYILLEFASTKYLLSPTGYVDEVWLLENDNWVSLGTEKDAY
jgi:hypothetical protein